MNTIAELTLPANRFALRDTLEAFPEARFEIRRIGYSAERVLPFVWVRGVDFASVEAAFATDESVIEVEALADIDSERLYWMEWTDDARVVISILAEENGLVLNARGQGDHWRIWLLFPNRSALLKTYEFCADMGLGPSLTGVTDVGDEWPSQAGLTRAQYETIRLAHEQGHYDIPRQATIDDLAVELGISHQATSERLRRAHGVLIGNILAIGR